MATSTLKKNDTVELVLQFGRRLRELRLRAGLTLQDVADKSGLAVSTISKIENAKSSPTYDVLLRLASGLGTDLAMLVDVSSRRNMESVKGRMSISRKNEGNRLEAGPYVYEPIATTLLQKKIDPTVVQVRARRIEEFEALVSHPGEELVFVVSGEVELHSDLYAPIRLRAGDSAYYDANMGHAYVSVSKDDATIINIVADGARPEGVNDVE
jgi:transcriptional regulator with XRE-family HTH domain